MMHVQTIATPARMPEVQARAWALAERIAVFGYAELCSELSISPRVARKIVAVWLDEKRIRLRQHGGARSRKMFEIPLMQRPATDRFSLVAQQLWTAARGLKQFSPRDLRVHRTADLRVEEALLHYPSDLRIHVCGSGV